jgi:energy-coupling factor transporter transmembrane protein EcfT
MNLIKTYLLLIIVIIFNIIIFWTKNIILLSIINVLLYLLGINLKSRKKTLKRIGYFVVIGISMVLFQIFFNLTIPIMLRIETGLKSTLLLSAVSQIIFMVIEFISPTNIISAFWFLPKQILLLLSMTFYFIPLLIHEQITIQLVQKSRGSRINVFASIIPLLYRIFQRSETISYTIVGRGYEN